MMRLPRFLPSLLVACVLAGPLVLALPARGQDAAAPAPAGPSKEVLQAAEDFWHYASIGRYELARAEGEKILGMSVPAPEVLAAFEAVVAERSRRLVSGRIDLYERLLGWQRIDELRDVSAKLIALFNKAKFSRAAEPAFIEQNIERLDDGRRAYLLAVEQLKESAELAVPIMINYLANPAKKELYVPIRSALRDLGYRALNPLVAATEMKDADTLTWVVMSLGDLGYDLAVPYLVRLVKANDVPNPVKTAATQALVRLNVSNAQTLDAAELFFDLAEKFYYNKAAITVPQGSAVGFLWSWTEGGLRKIDVPASTFNEDMAQRCCEYALRLDPSRGDAVSLWLVAGYEREVELAGGAHPIWDAKHPDTHYYAVTSGTRHLNPALARALADQNSAVALRSIRSLQGIAGASNLFAGDESKPILDALRYPDRQVRFEAAFTIAQSLPQQGFQGQEAVVPILAEALAQTGRAGVLVLARSEQELNARSEAVAKSGAYNVKGGVGAAAAIAAAADMGGVDVVIMGDQAPDQNDLFFAEAALNISLQRAARLIVVSSKSASPYAASAANNPLVTLTEATGGAELAAAIEEARKRAGGLPLDEKIATAYALRAANLLGRLAISRGQVLDLSAAQSALLAALGDARDELALTAGDALAVTNFKEAQVALLDRSLAEKTPDPMKIEFLNNLATNAKFFGNQMEAPLIERLTRFVESAPNLEVRSAAAEAHGALNPSSDQVKSLILNHANR